jgi:hypothetical protein
MSPLPDGRMRSWNHRNGGNVKTATRNAGKRTKRKEVRELCGDMERYCWSSWLHWP